MNSTGDVGPTQVFRLNYLRRRPIIINLVNLDLNWYDGDVADVLFNATKISGSFSRNSTFKNLNLHIAYRDRMNSLPTTRHITLNYLRFKRVLIRPSFTPLKIKGISLLHNSDHCSAVKHLASLQ